MKIISLSVQNFRSLRNVTLAGLGDLVVLIGPNSSGKTNVIEALKFFFDGFGRQGSRNIKGIPDYLWFNRDTNERITFRLTLQLSNNEFRFEKPFTGDSFDEEESLVDRASLPTLSEETSQLLGIKAVNTIEVTRCVSGAPSEASWSTDRLVLNENIIVDQREIALNTDVCKALYSRLMEKALIIPPRLPVKMIDRLLCSTFLNCFQTIWAARSQTEVSKQLGDRESFLHEKVLSAMATLGQTLEKVKEGEWEFIEESMKQIEPSIGGVRSIDGKITIKEQGSRFQLPTSLIGGGRSPRGVGPSLRHKREERSSFSLRA